MIRKASKEDLPICSELIQQVIGEIVAKYYSPEIIRAWQEYNSLPNLEKEFRQAEFIVCEEAGLIVGVGALKENHIEKVYVLPSFQGKGIGKSLLMTLEQNARAKGLAEWDLNATINSSVFYKKLGYKEQDPVTIEKNGLSVAFTKMTKRI
jgi:N-acetylglutamate synthase-like GNAT family acetyltransferase